MTERLHLPGIPRAIKEPDQLLRALVREGRGKPSETTATRSAVGLSRVGVALAIACQQYTAKYQKVWAGDGYIARLQGA